MLVLNKRSAAARLALAFDTRSGEELDFPAGSITLVTFVDAGGTAEVLRYTRIAPTPACRRSACSRRGGGVMAAPPHRLACATARNAESLRDPASESSRSMQRVTARDPLAGAAAPSPQMRAARCGCAGLGASSVKP